MFVVTGLSLRGTTISSEDSSLCFQDLPVLALGPLAVLPSAVHWLSHRD